MEIETFEVIPGVEYLWDVTDGWNWFGERRWWNVFVVFANGINGGGGACIEERWRWNKSNQTIRRQPRNLTCEETVAMINQIKSRSNNAREGQKERGDESC